MTVPACGILSCLSPDIVRRIQLPGGQGIKISQRSFCIGIKESSTGGRVRDDHKPLRPVFRGPGIQSYLQQIPRLLIPVIGQSRSIRAHMAGKAAFARLGMTDLTGYGLEVYIVRLIS